MRRAVLLAVGLAVAVPACRSEQARRNPADAIIEQETDPEARKELEAVRDATNEEMRQRVAALDAEIERLKKENEELRKTAGR